MNPIKPWYHRVAQCQCRGCDSALAPREVREIVLPKHGIYGPLCAECADLAESMTFAEWLDEMWARQHPN